MIFILDSENAFTTHLSFLSALKEKFADIFFLVDSGLSTAEFQQVRSVLIRLVNQLNFSASTYRLGMAQYGQDIKVEFLFKAHQTKEDILNAIKRLRHRRLQPNEAQQLGTALMHVYNNVFTSEAGSRSDQSFRQYLVVISGKASADDAYKEAHLLKSAGIKIISFSAGTVIDDLKILASPEYSYNTLNGALPTLKQILEKQEEVTTVTDGENFLCSEPLKMLSIITRQHLQCEG